MLVADHHHSRAITGLMETLSKTIDPSSSNAVFANVVLTFFYAFIAFGPLCNEIDENTAAHTARVLGASWVPLIRRMDPIVARVYGQVAAGPLGSLPDIAKYLEVQPGTEEDPNNALLERTRDLWTTDKYGDEDKQVYDEALRALRRCNMWLKLASQIRFDDDGPRRANYGPWSGPFIWISMINLLYRHYA
jgi:hypothetical protein